MKIIGVIPARYASTRFSGKPLADICGKPMIWWVVEQVKKVKELSEVYVATDDERIRQACLLYNVKCIMTSSEHASVFERINEFAKKVPGDEYIVINGDEPLINPQHIEMVIDETFKSKTPFIVNTICAMTEPSEVCDSANIKVVFDKNMRALFMSRTPIPYPYKSIQYQYYKHVGITGINKSALEKYTSSPKGYLETIEGIDHLRFIDNSLNMKFKIISDCFSLSVDTPKDLEKVRMIIAERIEKGEI